MIFVDSSAWYAVFSRREVNHLAAVSFIRSATKQLVTTDYVIDETLTLLRVRGETRRAILFGERVIHGQWVAIHRISDDDFVAAWIMFRDFHDKKWSFTDCTSRVVIDELGIRNAFAFDERFRQFGNVVVVP